MVMQIKLIVVVVVVAIKGFRKGSSMDYFSCIKSPLKRQHNANIVLFVNNFLRFLINYN